MNASISRKLVFTFPVFYFTAIINNTALGKHRATHMLICGFDPDDISVPDAKKLTISNTISTGYISGNRPISENLTSHYLNCSRDDHLNRIRKLGIQNPTMAVGALVQLLKSSNLNLDGTSTSAMLTLSSSETAEEFLVDMLTLAIKHRVKQPISKEEQNYLVGLRRAIDNADEVPDADNTGEPILQTVSMLQDPFPFIPVPALPHLSSKMNPVSSSPALSGQPTQNSEESNPAWNRPDSIESDILSCPLRALYTVRELDYAAEREEYKDHILKLHSSTALLTLSEEDILASRDLFRRSDKTFLIEFEGSLSGMTDVLLHRVSKQQCTQIVFVAGVNSKKEYLNMRNALKNIFEFAIADDGRMFVACGYDPGIPENEYRMRIVYSLKTTSDEEKNRFELVTNPPILHLMPAQKYEGRVPDFLLPFRPERN